MFHKVKEVYPLPNMMLSVIFTDGTTKTYDIAPLTARFEIFKALEASTLFESVKVEQGGYGIYWNDNIDSQPKTPSPSAFF